VVFAGGCSGGHLMPGVATAHALSSLVPGTRALFLRTVSKAEDRCSAVLEPFEHAAVPATPWRGWRNKAAVPVRVLAAGLSVARLMRRFRPHVVVGLGSCNSVVPVLAGRAAGLRTVVLEANAVPGRAVRALAPLVDCVVLQWPGAAASLEACRIVVAGNPVRQGLLGVDPGSARRRLGLAPDRCFLLVMGGSQGAAGLNQLLVAALRRVRSQLQVIHVTGAGGCAGRRCLRGRSQVTYRAVEFIADISDAYAAADLVVSRSGASTLAEIAAVGVPSVLVPHPSSPDGHQQANAAVLGRAGAALVLDQRRTAPSRLAAAIDRLAGDPARRERMARRARALGRPGAAFRVARLVAELVGVAPATEVLPVGLGTGEAGYTEAA
jgi:UDP-N-acetylglucosamine--N-acetylmuramyl-(pentapeptide) pyrophosphoryl-undecaprenol N-acetylglucosamine transferase